MNRVELSTKSAAVKTAPIVRGINYNETDKHKLGCGARARAARPPPARYCSYEK